MAVAIGEAVDLVLDRRTVTRARGSDRTGEQRRTMQVRADDAVAAGVGPGNRAEDLWVQPPADERRHRPRVLVGRLLFSATPVAGARITARRCPGLVTSHRQRHFE